MLAYYTLHACDKIMKSCSEYAIFVGGDEKYSY